VRLLQNGARGGFQATGHRQERENDLQGISVLGPDSVQGSKAALASVKQGKYTKFHDTLMNARGHLSNEIIFAVAKESGLDVEKLKEDMADDSIGKIMHANIVLGGEIGTRGTPTFVIGEQMFGGAMKYEQMQQAVDDARQKKTKEDARVSSPDVIVDRGSPHPIPNYRGRRISSSPLERLDYDLAHSRAA
jgi:predicted DsbA family dithiol-disulfide isomerase